MLGFFHALLGYNKMRKYMKNSAKILVKFCKWDLSHCFMDWNSIKIPLKFHQNITQIVENTTKIPSKYPKNSIRIPVLSTKKRVVFHWNNSGKHVVNLGKIDGSIPMVFQWNSIKIPLWFQMFTSGTPAEFLRNTDLKFQHFF